jgi:hypothetical protein
VAFRDLAAGLREAIVGRGPLDRETYVTVGIVVVAAKFLVDAAAVYAVTGVVWTPLDYIYPLVSLNASKTATFPPLFAFALLVWAIPFIWLGVSMSARRAVDAGIPVWVIVAFFLPLLNYVLLVLLAMLPTTRQPDPPVAAKRPEGTTRVFDAPAIAAVAIGAATGLTAVVIGTLLIRTYGLSLFLGSPFLIGVLTGNLANKGVRRSAPETTGLVTLAVVLAGGALLMFALEGAVCIVMALPIALPIAFIGGMIGRSIAERHESAPGWTGMALLFVLMPAGALGDRARVPDVRVVTTAVDIQAEPSRVWRSVIAFEPITAPPSWEFRLGLAYPLSARIEGTGPGAVRYCEFSTGPFVEPITDWEQPSRLAFDVRSQPPALQEWSPYSHVYAPHLQGFFKTTHGEFRLVGLPGGRTRLEGRTWYSLKMAPAIYWNPLADSILHRIHRRVLDHVKAAAERTPR